MNNNIKQKERDEVCCFDLVPVRLESVHVCLH